MSTQIVGITALPREVWSSAFTATPDAPPSLGPLWSDAVARHRGARDSGLLYSLSSGRRLLLPLSVGRSTPWGAVAQSWPVGWGYGGVLVEGGGAPSAAELSLVLADLNGHRFLRTRVCPDPLAAPVWAAARSQAVRAGTHATQVVDLDGGFQQVADRFAHGVRREVRKAERRGVEVTPDQDGALLADFARLYDAAVVRWGADRGQPPWLAQRLAARHDRSGQLRAVQGCWPQGLTLWGARLAGETVAVYAVLSHQERAWEWLGAVDLERARQTGATAALLSTILEHECGQGRRWLDLGESDPGSGVEERKRRFGARAVPFETLHLERVPMTRAVELARSGVVRALAARARSAPRRRPAPTPAARADLPH